MPTNHVVEQGEYLSQIAEQYGYCDYRTLWQHPMNADLRQLRQNPNVLFPGDTVFIPDKTEKRESAPTGRTTIYQVAGHPLFLHLALKDFGDQPLANTQCEIQFEGKSISFYTDSEGHMKMPISRTAKDATLVFKDSLVPFDLAVPIKIGHLDPVDEVSGQRARLSNLGYITQPLEEVDDVIFSNCVQEFQCDSGLPVTGECDSVTQDKLKEAHGS